MLFKKVILIRHGFANTPNRDLDSTGIFQMQYLATHELRELIPKDASVSFWGSSAPRAVQSMNIIKGILGIEYQIDARLWSDDLHTQNNYEVMRLLRSIAVKERSDVLLCVTHKEYCNELPRELVVDDHENFIKYELDVAPRNCVFIDFEKKTYRKIV